MFVWTPFLQLRTLLNLYYLCLLGLLCTLCHSWFCVLETHTLECPSPWMSVFCFHSQFQYVLSKLCPVGFPPQVFLLSFFAALGTANLTLSGTFLLASAPGGQPPWFFQFPECSFFGFVLIFPPSPLSALRAVLPQDIPMQSWPSALTHPVQRFSIYCV